EAALSVLGLVRNFLEGRRDGDRVRAARVADARVRDLTVQQVEQEQLVELRDGDVPRDARAAVALRVGEEVAEVDVGEPPSRQKNAAVRKLEGGRRRHSRARPSGYAAADECWSSLASMNSRRTAPMIWSTTFPSLKNSSVGIDRTLKRALVLTLASVSSLVTF